MVLKHRLPATGVWRVTFLLMSDRVAEMVLKALCDLSGVCILKLSTKVVISDIFRLI